LVPGGFPQGDLSGSLVVQRLVKPLFVVEPEVVMDSGSGFLNGFILTQINGFIFV
jgi:hypothetical protein